MIPFQNLRALMLQCLCSVLMMGFGPKGRGEEPPAAAARSRELQVGPGMIAAGCDLRSLRFVEKDLSGADFSGADLRCTQFEGCVLRGTSFRGAKLGGAGIELCDTDGADFTDAEIDTVVSPHTLELKPHQVKATKSYASRRFEGCSIVTPSNDVGDYDFRGFVFKSCSFLGNLTDADFTDATLTDFSGSLSYRQLSTTRSFQRKRLNRVRVTVSGAADFTDVTFVDSSLRLRDAALFQNARFVGQCSIYGKFVASQLSTTHNYRNGDLSGMRFSEVDFADFDFSHQNLTGVTFSNCTFGAAKFDGAVISRAMFCGDTTTSMDLSVGQIRATWNFRCGRLEGIVLPDVLTRELIQTEGKTE